MIRNYNSKAFTFATASFYRFSLWRILLLSTVLAISGCGDAAKMIRKATYPPDFKYVSGQELRSHMNQLAFQLQQLDQALSKSDSLQQQEILDTLRNIEQIGINLQAGEAGSNHPFLQDFMSNFVNKISTARNAASLDPPRYYFAGLVAGGCINCHKVNR